MKCVVARVGAPEGGAQRASFPDLSVTRSVLERACSLWPQEDLTPFVGVYNGRPCVGFITDRYRKAVRFSGPTFEEALARASAWTAENAGRLAWERENDRLDHPQHRSAPPRSA